MSAQPVRYPTNNVIAVLESSDQVIATVEGLTGSGFLASEFDVRCGGAAAERLEQSPGRRGLLGLVISVAEKLGFSDEEMKQKDRYEEALRSGRYLVRVSAPSDERKDIASRILNDNGATEVNFFGPLTIEPM